MVRQVITTAEFGPQEAGLRVGWASAARLGEQVWQVGVVSGTVGPEGATLGHIEHDGQVLYDARRALGMKAVAGFFTVIDGERGARCLIQPEIRWAKDAGDAAGIMQWGVGYTGSVESPDDRNFATGATPLVTTLRQTLHQVGADEQYPSVYYALNGLLGREDYRTRQGLPRIKLEEVLLADPDMAERTLLEEAGAGKILELLEKIRAADEGMVETLETSTLAAVSAVTDSFSASRLLVAELERELRELVESAVLAPSSVYLPGAALRTHPAMDPGEHDVARSFGAELAMVTKGNYGSPCDAVAAELIAIRRRQDFAQKGRAVLAALQHAEQQGTC
jgi:hypothetical protein